MSAKGLVIDPAELNESGCCKACGGLGGHETIGPDGYPEWDECSACAEWHGNPDFTVTRR